MREPPATIYLDFLSFALRFHPMAIFKSDVSMVIEGMYCHGWKTGQSLLEILPKLRAEIALVSGLHAHRKRGRTRTFFLSLSGFLLCP